GVGLPGLIEDISSVLPLHELKVHIEKKVETNEYYKMLHEAIHSPEFMKMLHTLRHLPEYHELVEFHRKIHVEHMEHHRNH
ncbi:hypothetical protein FIU32_16230, partial [Enterococcus faecium]|uniref:hypothetical protein n=1 Tax=Enterococcus faecium TaxID=1352 RepID=UPI00112053EC